VCVWLAARLGSARLGSARLGSADGGNWVGATSSVTADDTIGYHDLDGDTRISAAEFEQNYKVRITQGTA
jgi:hypothetical protein